MKAPWWWSKTKIFRSDIYVYFDVNFKVFFFFRLIRVHLLVSELYIPHQFSSGRWQLFWCVCIQLHYISYTFSILYQYLFFFFFVAQSNEVSENSYSATSLSFLINHSLLISCAWFSFRSKTFNKSPWRLLLTNLLVNLWIMLCIKLISFFFCCRWVPHPNRRPSVPVTPSVGTYCKRVWFDRMLVY